MDFKPYYKTPEASVSAAAVFFGAIGGVKEPVGASIVVASVCSAYFLSRAIFKRLKNDRERHGFGTSEFKLLIAGLSVLGFIFYHGCPLESSMICSAVMMSLLPVAVTNRSAVASTSSSVTTS